MSEILDPGRDSWLSIEMRHLAALAAVAEERSFSDAADRLGYVQSAISQQIAHLEHVTGRRLVNRAGGQRTVALTAAGALLLAHTAEMQAELRLARLELAELAEQPQRTARIGIARPYAAWLPGMLLPAMACEAAVLGWPRVEEAGSNELTAAVIAGRLDAAFVELPITAGPLFAAELVREELVLVHPRDPEADVRRAHDVLARWPLAAIDGCAATAALRATAGPRRQAAGRASAVDSATSALLLVRARLAVAVVGTRDVPAGDDSLATIALPELPARVLGLTWHRDRDGSEPVQTLRRCAAEALREPAPAVAP